MNFDILVRTITETHSALYQQAVKAVNVNLTLRNWLVGLYIVEFEQNGEDRARYGEKLLPNLVSKIAIKGLSETMLKLCRQFYSTYPNILGSATQKFTLQLSHQLFNNFPDTNRNQLPSKIRRLVTDELQVVLNKNITIRQSATDELTSSDNSYLFSLLKTTSFTHFAELVQIDDPIKRKFYELLILKTTPSVKELKRQIETLAFERLGLSGDKNIALAQLESKIVPAVPSDAVKSHYFFDFLDLKNPQLIEETELEQALIDHLQAFIIELGNGFCFEARQKRVLIGDEYFFIDLVFYHRILKCHVLIDLKTEKAKHTHIGQLKAYVQHYKKTVMTSDDNPPVGILLVTEQNKTLVEYAIAESDKELFVSKYILQLPNKTTLEAFINNELRNI